MLSKFEALDLGLHALQYGGVGLGLDLSGFESWTGSILGTLTLGAGRAVGRSAREYGLALDALVVWYRAGPKLIPRVPERILVFLGPARAVSDALSNEGPEGRRMEGQTYGSLGQSVQRTCSHLSHLLLPVAKRAWHSWHVRLTLWRGFLWTRSGPPVLLGLVRGGSFLPLS